MYKRYSVSGVTVAVRCTPLVSEWWDYHVRIVPVLEQDEELYGKLVMAWIKPFFIEAFVVKKYKSFIVWEDLVQSNPEVVASMPSFILSSDPLLKECRKAYDRKRKIPTFDSESGGFEYEAWLETAPKVDDERKSMMERNPSLAAATAYGPELLSQFWDKPYFLLQLISEDAESANNESRIEKWNDLLLQRVGV